MYSVGNIIKNTIMSLYGDGLVIRLLVVINFEMHRNIELLCCTSGTNIVL